MENEYYVDRPYTELEERLLEDLGKAYQQGKADGLKEVEKFFIPATSSRGQGGLPLHGTVKDWSMTITKDGWETIKQELTKPSV